MKMSVFRAYLAIFFTSGRLIPVHRPLNPGLVSCPTTVTIGVGTGRKQLIASEQLVANGIVSKNVA